MPTNVYGPPDHRYVEPNQEVPDLEAGLVDYDTHIVPEYQSPDCFWEWSTDAISDGGSVTIQVYLGWTCEFTYVAPDYQGTWACCVVMRATDVTLRNNGKDDPQFATALFFSD